MKSNISLHELTKVSLFGAVGFVFYILTGPTVDTFLPVLGCLVRPVIFLSFITSQYHLTQRQLFYISIISTLIYAFVVPCFLNYTSIPTSAVFILFLTLFRKRLNKFVLIFISSLSSFVTLALLALVFSPQKTDFFNILKSSPYFLLVVVIIGVFQLKFGKVNCLGCNLCDPKQMKD